MHGLNMTFPIFVAAITTIFVLGIGGWMTTIEPRYENLRKPSWNPPNWVFGPTWTVILGLAAWSGVLAWMNAFTGAEKLWILLLRRKYFLSHALESALSNLRRPSK